MSDLLRWSPFERRNPFDLMDQFRRLFDSDAGRSMIRVEEETKDNVLTVRAELPGVDPDKDVEISVSDGQLHIRAERTETTEQKDEGNYRSEFHYGSMYRSLPLPKGVKEEDITATYKDGVLEVKAPVPQTEGGTKPQKIQISRN
ncbi:Hsp20/alpha crystallin family protein [Arthrobacter bambusae]|uniref:Hsp20/alpha crystallin family protein n=1 Tax=Arthrobacter bambusae TaxID=1338426 RepID=UPI00277E4E8C|nr:Hsp20/alpha crystallin family protein [Arthrobacter bambusae]MDQ0028700.1 HSP20 family protein [Arthrobacter bambusae]MDQ0096506.1 HSP20 family protein [Arthrobacter bambusae]